MLYPLIMLLMMEITSPPVAVTPLHTPKGLGNCVNKSGGNIDLKSMLFLEESAIVVENKLERFSVSLSGKSVKIEDLKDSRRGFYITSIAYEVEPNDNLDIELKIALLKGVPVIYWKETYKHRIYRQGLFGLTASEPVFICQGKGSPAIHD